MHQKLIVEMKKLDRRTFMKIFALAVGIVASPCGLKTLALSGSDIDNLQLADGAYAEQLTFEIAKEFENSPEVFLQQISGLSNRDLKWISNYLFHAYSYGDIKTLQMTLREIGKNEIDEKAKTTLNDVSRWVSQYISEEKESGYFQYKNPTYETPSRIPRLSTWKINVVLPSNRNYKGVLDIYAASGMRLLSCECLGLAESNGPMNQYKGNTPTGIYDAKLAGPHSNTYSYGPYKYVSTTPQSGIAHDAGRSGIWIHGGDPAPASSAGLPRYPLRPTYGCVRVSNSDQSAIQNVLTSQSQKSGVLEITERN